MQYIFNREKIENLIMDFHESTGISITIYDSTMTTVAASQTDPPYCAYLRKFPELLNKCTRSDMSNLKIVEKTKKPLYYTCHAGIMEVITPIFYDDTLIAYLQIGQFRDEEKIYSSWETTKKIALHYGLSTTELQPLYESLATVSQKKLQSLVNLTDLIVKSFWVDGLIYANRSMLSVKIEQYIESRLREKLSIDELCEKFFLSKNALYRLFHTEFETTVHEYVLQKRIDLAKKTLLNEPQLDVGQIAEKCGFPDSNYFIRAFRERIGITPHQFRKAER